MQAVTIAGFVVICLAGSTIQSVCGFGFGVLVMMLLPWLLHSTLSSVVIASFLGMSTSLIAAARYRRFISWRKVLLPLIGYLAISTLSVRLSAAINEQVIRRLLGGALLVMSGYFLFFSGRVRIRPNPGSALLLGGLAGFMSAMFSMSGPPLSVYCLSASGSNEEYLSMMQTLTVLGTLYINAVRMASGMFGRQEILLCAIGVVAVYLGTLIGKRIFSRLDANALRRAIYLLMAVSGLILLFES